MTRTLIQQHTSEIIKGFIGEADALKELDHKVLKGQLRELFTTKILKKFLTIQFGIGNGVIINQKGKQSTQIDIIIYDKRILPPFIEEQEIGVYPAESVLAVIEVRSRVSKEVIKKYSDSAKKLYDEIYHPGSSIYRDYPTLRPMYSLIGFDDREIFKNKNREEILQWMKENAYPLIGVCCVNKFSWLKVGMKGSFQRVNENNEETKAFIGVLLDNIRTLSQKRYLPLVNHKDWLGVYIRDQPRIRDFLNKGSWNKET